MDYSLIKDLIDYAEAYQESHASQKLEDFIIWLNNELFDMSPAEHKAHDQLLIAFKLIQLNRTLKRLSKSALAASNVSSMDEYSFLLHLSHQESFRKMEIVELHQLESPTGIEIIKRLIKHNLVEEFPDETDRRAKRIRITLKGKEELKGLQSQIDAIFHSFTEPLTLEEQILMSALLNRLMVQLK